MRDYDEFVKTAALKKKDPAYKILKRAKSANMDRWGASPDTNTLYITGYSGSGKSTIAKALAKKYGAKAIHLDEYFEGSGSGPSGNIDQDFERFIKAKQPSHTEIRSPKSIKRHSKEWGKEIDTFTDNITEFSKQQHKKGNRVIVEGVQLHDETAHPDKNFFIDKPVLIPSTSALTSYRRARKRDGIERKLFDLQKEKEVARWYADSAKTIKHLRKTVGAKRGWKPRET